MATEILVGSAMGSASPMVTVSVSRSRARSPRPFIDGWWIRFISSLRHPRLTKYRGGSGRVPWPIGQFGCPTGYVCRSDTRVCQHRVSRSASGGTDTHTMMHHQGPRPTPLVALSWGIGRPTRGGGTIALSIHQG